jgi:hypothetical protein
VLCRLVGIISVSCWLLCLSVPGLTLAQNANETTNGAAAAHAAAPADVRDEWQVIQTLCAQPTADADDVDKRIIGNVEAAGETFCVRIANMGTDADAATITWDVGRYTGFHPGTRQTMAQFQRGPQDAAEGTAVQIQGTEVGIWIDSDSPRPRQGALLPVTPAYWWWDVKTAPRPFQQPDRQLAFSFDMQVPTAQRQGKAEVYVCAYFLLRDQQSGQALWLGASLFDLRSVDRFPDTVHVDNWEAGTGLPILFTALNERSAWLHPAPGSAHFADNTFAEYRHFEFRVSAAELAAAVRAMKSRWPKFANVSEDASDYQLTHFNVNPEVYAPEGSRGRLGLALRNIRVALLGPAGDRPRTLHE